MRFPRWRGLAAMVLVAGLLALWLLWPRDRASPAGEVRLAVRATPAPAIVVPTPEPFGGATRDWLLGTWSLRDNNGSVDAPCDQASAITYLANGQYFASGASGRYALGGEAISYWGRILYDIDAGEDRSHFEERTSVPVTRIGAHALQLGDALLYRCLKAASDRAS